MSSHSDPAKASAAIVLAAVGESEEVSTLVLATAMRLVSCLPGGRLHLVHVVDTLPGAEAAIRDNAWKHAGAEGIRKKADALLERWTQRAEQQLGYRPETHLEYGAAGARVVELATRLAPDFLVIGPLDKAIWERVAFGSSAEQVLRKAPCTVVLARPSARAS